MRGDDKKPTTLENKLAWSGAATRADKSVIKSKNIWNYLLKDELQKTTARKFNIDGKVKNIFIF